jgi:3-hydroxyisobutyrate dehydrogenase-like beta-hydroxyacid dehydrogenase
MTTFERVGFIGLGGMGRGLVKNLVAKGVAVTAYDLNPAAVGVPSRLARRPPAASRRFATAAASS